MSIEVLRRKVLIYQQSSGEQIMVELWPDGAVEVATRPDSSGVWSPPLHAIRVEGE